MGQLKTKVIHSTRHNPWYNLALEEYLFNQVSKDELIFYLWQNEQTVVIGRNQNAWKECQCKLLEDQGGKLARRLSGGGAVYHDLGNLNFTFIMDRKLYNLEKQLKVILETVKSLGIAAQFSGRNDLLVGEKKFSGNAFYLSGRSAYHHGTILLDTDFEKLVTYLQVSQEKIKAKGIESVRSRVINLREIMPALTIDILKTEMEKSFAALYAVPTELSRINPVTFSEIESLYEKYSSWEWRYGQTPEFDIKFENRFSWGGMELCLKLKKAIITEAVIYSDAMDSNLIQTIASSLRGVPFNNDNIVSSIEAIERDDAGKTIIKDLIKWVKTKSI